MGIPGKKIPKTQHYSNPPDDKCLNLKPDTNSTAAYKAAAIAIHIARLNTRSNILQSSHKLVSTKWYINADIAEEARITRKMNILQPEEGW